jgi:hypothetical protein
MICVISVGSDEIGETAPAKHIKADQPDPRGETVSHGICWRDAR